MKFLLPIVVGLLTACQSAPKPTVDQLAGDVIAALDDGNPEEAERLFERGVGDGDTREQLYPKFYTTAKRRFDAGDPGGAATLLQFVSEKYPKATAAREALLYSLFLSRSRSQQPTAQISAGIERVLQELKSRQVEPSAWVYLVEAQHNIDAKLYPDARRSYQKFRQQWDGTPPELLLYVEDIDRFLQTQ